MAALSIPFTVAEALQLEVFHTARVLAGAGGLQRPIQWVHIVEIPDIPRWVKGGELLLSDAQVLVSDLGRQPDLIEQLHTLGIAGIVFSPLGAVTSLPAALLQAADRARLPVIEVPYEFRYVELTEAILRRLVDREGALIRQAMNTHLRLTRVVLQGGDLTDLARALAELVRCALRLESPDLQTLAQAAWPPARAGSRTAAGPPSLGRFAQADLRQQLLATQIPIRVPAPAREPAAPAKEPAAASESAGDEWIVAPIAVGGEVLGYITLRGAERRLNELDLQTVESAATVAALILLRQRAIAEAEARFRGDWLTQLVDGTFREDAPGQSHLARCGLSGDHDHQVLALEVAGGAVAQDPALQASLTKTLAGLRLNTLHGSLGRRWICILEFRREPGGGAALAHQLNRLSPHIRIGLGEPGRGWGWIPTSYRQALDALTIVTRLPSLGRQSAGFGELGFLHWLLSLSEAERQANPYIHKVAALRAQPPRRGSDLLHTLELFLEAGGNGQRAARLLQIHRSTLNYRLKRIAEICGVDLADPLVRLNLYLALKALQLTAG